MQRRRKAIALAVIQAELADDDNTEAIAAALELDDACAVATGRFVTNTFNSEPLLCITRCPIRTQALHTGAYNLAHWIANRKIKVAKGILVLHMNRGTCASVTFRLGN